LAGKKQRERTKRPSSRSGEPDNHVSLNLPKTARANPIDLERNNARRVSRQRHDSARKEGVETWERPKLRWEYDLGAILVYSEAQDLLARVTIRSQQNVLNATTVFKEGHLSANDELGDTG